MAPFISQEYNEIAQIVREAIAPTNEHLHQLNVKFDRLADEFIRKDLYETRHLQLKQQLTEYNERMEELEKQMRSIPQRMLLFGSSLLGIVLGVLTLLSYIQLPPH